MLRPTETKEYRKVEGSFFGANGDGENEKKISQENNDLVSMVAYREKGIQKIRIILRV